MRFQFTLARLLLAIAGFAAVLGGMKWLGPANMPCALVASIAVAGIVLVTGGYSNRRQLAASFFGWVVYGLLVGAGLGFAMVDLRSAENGSSWNGVHAVGDPLASIVGGCVVGILAGIAVDVSSQGSTWRNTALRVAWLLVPLFVIAYYPMLRPFFEWARE